MIRLRILVVITMVLLVSSLVPSVALAQKHTIKGFYYSGGFTLSGGASATWNTAFWGLDYRLTLPSPWGAQIQYASGSQSGWTGAFAGATSGSNAQWFADATYRLPVQTVQNAIVRAHLGYGSFNNTTSGSPQFTSSGFRVGVDAEITLPNTPWSINGSVAWYPSNSTSAGASSSNASTTDWQVSGQYNFPNQWLAEVGYRSVSVGTGTLAALGCATACTASSTGWFIAIGKTFP